MEYEDEAMHAFGSMFEQERHRAVGERAELELATLAPTPCMQAQQRC